MGTKLLLTGWQHEVSSAQNFYHHLKSKGGDPLQTNRFFVYATDEKCRNILQTARTDQQKAIET